MDPLTGSYPWYTPYQFAGNKPIRYIDIDGLEEANPSFFTKTLNLISGDFHLNRMNKYITENNIDPETVISLANDTYIVKKTDINCTTKYSIFRKSKQGSWNLFASSENDDYDLSEQELLKTKIIGAFVLPAPDPISSGAKGSFVLAAYSRRNIVNLIPSVKKELVAWKKHIKLNILDINGISRDVLNKGIHIHFKNFKGMEASIVLEDGLLALKSIGEVATKDFALATKIFGEALKNQGFREDLLISFKTAIEGLEEASKFAKNSDQFINKTNELRSTLEAIIKL